MKNFIAGVCLLLAVPPIRGDFIDGYLEKAKDSIVTCAKENGFPEQSVREIFEKDAKAGLDQATCLRACVMKAQGTMKDSKINSEKMVEFIKAVHSDHPEMVKPLEKASAECIEKVKDASDECKIAYSYIECYLDKEMGLNM